MKPSDIIDPGDFCRTCKGHKGSVEITHTGGRIWCRCPQCRGTGLRTVRLDNQKTEAA